MALFTGQKVVAIYHWRPWRGIVMPEKGSVYTIRHIGEYPLGVGVLLAEIRNPPMPTTAGTVEEPSFLAAGFKPVVSRKTDISIFTKMLKTKQRELT